MCLGDKVCLWLRFDFYVYHERKLLVSTEITYKNGLLYFNLDLSSDFSIYSRLIVFDM